MKTILTLDAAVGLANADLFVINQSGKDVKIPASEVFTNVESILPKADLLYNLGDATHRFKEVHADEVFIGASSLYVNGKKVVEDNSDVMTFATDQDQAINIKTVATSPGSGNANISIQAGNEINVDAPGGVEFAVGGVASKNLTFTNTSVGGQIQFTGVTQVNGNLTVTGNLDIQGTTTTVDTENLLIEDNLITLNKNQTGTPSGTLIGGIEIERGDESNYRFVFEEASDTFLIGMQGSLQPVATREVAPVDTAVGFWNDTSKRIDTSSNLTFDGTDLKVMSQRVITASQGTSFPGSPGFGDECYRTDLDEWYKYNGAVWMQI